MFDDGDAAVVSTGLLANSGAGGNASSSLITIVPSRSMTNGMAPNFIV